jgi:CHAD domain-containing protein
MDVSPEQLAAGAAATTGWETTERTAAADVAPDEPGFVEESLAGLIRSFLVTQYREIISGDEQLRSGRDAIHPTRVATRRTRSVLRVFADLFEPEAAQSLDAELAWYAQALGRVRDVQVMRAHLMDAMHELPDDVVFGPVAASLWRTFDRDEHAARDALDEVLASDRYALLLLELRAWIDTEPFGTLRPASDVRTYLRAAERTVDRKLRHAAAHADDDERMHSARKAAKRARYVAELAQPVAGKRARRMVKRSRKLQDKLGSLQDAVVAVEFLRRAGAEIGVRPGENGFTVGVLWAREQARVDRERKRARRGVRRAS